ncbi:hypothetical protein [Tepidibacter hydrothermalis]|uniref:Uncharacterized protein n=1 Tax=Tepidibacter hydrothermalis TaxID=3036126 RepID=A0ABY8EL71_9FIRM|nr:hypothetical protein [Tepidibacter hydrothermalis]WFD12013.1 hypothetical protein P4S50_08020 [Tepidibacter hydrothermalis]
MGDTVAKSLPLADIVLAEIVTEETTPVTYKFKTASECKLSPKLSKGKEKILRIKNTIHSKSKTKDICIGMDLTLKDNVFTPDVFALVDGGTITYDKGNSEKFTYEAPQTGKEVKRTKFKLNLYTAKKDSAGEITGYVKLSYPHCEGTPVSFNLKDEDFMVPQMKIESAPGMGESPYSIEYLALDELTIPA